MKLKKMYPGGSTGARGLKNPTVTMSFNKSSTKNPAVIFRITISEPLMQEMNVMLGDRMEIDIDVHAGTATLTRVDPADKGVGWKVIPSNKTSKYNHGMLVPLLPIITDPIRAEHTKIIEKGQGFVKVQVPELIMEALKSGSGHQEDSAVA